jgi:hypothetical protein
MQLPQNFAPREKSMVRGLFAGGTDYSHQSFEDILTDLGQWVTSLKETSDNLRNNIKKLEISGYWKKVDPDFTYLIHYSMKFFDTSIQEFSEILEDIKKEVRPDHIRRLNALYKAASRLDIDYGRIWHQEYKNKEYGNKEFIFVEKIYSEGRSMAIDMRDLSNLSSRLRDFIGKKSIDNLNGDSQENIDLLELKPNIFGLGINLNELIKRLFKRKK